MGGEIFWDKVCLAVVSNSSLLSWMSPSSLVDKTTREWIHNNLAPFGGSVFKQIRGVQTNPLSPHLLF